MPGASAQLGAVLTTFESWPLAVRCLEALQRWGRLLDRILVVDDHSSRPPETLPVDSRVSVRINEARRGFAATLNSAIEAVGTEVALVFDADAYPLSDASEEVCAAFARDSKLGLLGFRTVDARGFESPSWSEEPGALPMVLGQRLDGWVRRLRRSRKPDDVCIHAAAMAVRREAFLAIGGADEALGFLDVDIDLSMRLRRAGWRVRWDPALVAYHEGGGSPVTTRWRVQEFYRSRLRLLRKHGLVHFPRLFRAAVVARLSLEYLALMSLGGWLFRDRVQRQDKVSGRRELISLVMRELH